MSGSFQRRRLRATFTNQKKPFKDGSTEMVLTGLRMAARVTDATRSRSGALAFSVWGLTKDHFNDLFYQPGPPWFLPPTALKIKIEAASGDETNWTLVWEGTVFESRADYNAMPEVMLFVTAAWWFKPSLDDAKPHSFTGAVDVADILTAIARDAGLTFTNDNYPPTSLENMVLAGSSMAQIETVVIAVPSLDYEMTETKMTIWSREKGRSGVLLQIGPDTGMIGYPVISSQGTMLRTRFNPGLRNGQVVEVQSSLPIAKGKWRVISYSHALDAEMPGGLWETEIVTAPVGTTSNG